MIQTEENDENFGLDLGLLGLNLGHLFFPKKLASSVTRCHG